MHVEYVLTPRSVNQFIHELPFFGQNFQSIQETYTSHFNVLHIKYFPPDETDSAEQQQ